jgi:sugar O-acyltransferase (sialic acid O-acetyltransferase NeuD family)
MRLLGIVQGKGYQAVSYVSSRAFVWRNVEIGENCFIFEDNTLQPFAKIGRNVILWSGNHIGHHSIIKDNCFISSHVVISGFCEVGENCYLGVNSTVANNVKVANDCFIDAGTVILKDTEQGKIYRGNPAEAAKVGSLRFFRVRE